MASYIDWYLVELERRLSGRISAERLFAVTSEVEDHLRLKSDDLVEAGMNEAVAQRTSVESFGSPDSVASEVLEGTAKPGSKRLGVGLVTSATIGLYGLGAVIAYTGFIPSPMKWWTIAAGLPLLVMLCWGSVMARRPLGRRLLMIAIPGTIAVVLLLPSGFVLYNGTPNPRLWINEHAKAMTFQTALMQDDYNGLKSGLTFYRDLAAANGDRSQVKGYPPMDREGPYLLLPRSKFFLPEQVGILTPPSSYGLLSIQGKPFRVRLSDQGSVTIRPAMDDWLRRGPAMLAETRQQLWYTKDSLAGLKAAQVSPREYTRTGVLCALAASVGGLMVVAVLNLACVGLARRGRLRRIQRPLVA